MMLTPKSPCEATITPGRKGGLTVTLFVPTYEGGVELELVAERDGDGDWRVFLPMWPDEGQLAEPIANVTHGRGTYEVCGGILHVGAPDVERERTTA